MGERSKTKYGNCRKYGGKINGILLGVDDIG